MTTRGHVIQQRRQDALFLEATKERRRCVMSRPEHETFILARPGCVYGNAPKVVD